MRQGDEVYYLHGDHLGSMSLTTDSSGDKVSEARYLPYGQVRWESGSTPTDFGFTSQRNDAYIKLIQMGARWYDSQLGRFISPDTIVPDPKDPQNFNRYSYALGNPVKYRDPSGHDVDCGIGESNCRRTVAPPPQDDPNEGDTGEDAMSWPDAYTVGAVGSLEIPFIKKLSPTGGLELLSLVDENGQLTIPEMFHYGGGSLPIGGGAGAVIYAGGIWNLPDSGAYEGAFESVDGTLSLGASGVTVAYFWAPSTNVPVVDAFTSGNVKGFYVGYAPGAKVSVSYNKVEYGNTAKELGTLIADAAWNGNWGNGSLMGMFKNIQSHKR